jgi:hypothetical protein
MQLGKRTWEKRIGYWRTLPINDNQIIPGSLFLFNLARLESGPTDEFT